MRRVLVAIALAGCNPALSTSASAVATELADADIVYTQPIQPVPPQTPAPASAAQPLPPDFPPSWLGQPGVVANPNGNALILIPEGQFVSVIQLTDVNGNVLFAAAPTGPNVDPGSIEVAGGQWPLLPRNGTHATLLDLLEGFIAQSGGPPAEPNTTFGGGIQRVNGVYYVNNYSGGVPAPFEPPARITFAATLAAQLDAPVVTFVRSIAPIAGVGVRGIPNLTPEAFLSMGPTVVEPNGTSYPLTYNQWGPQAPPIIGNPPTIANTTVLVGGTMVATALAYELGGPYWAGGTATAGGGISGYYYSGSISGAAGGAVVSGVGFVGGLAGNYLAVNGAQMVGVTDPTAVYWIGQGGSVAGGAVSSGAAAAGLTYLGVPVVAGATTAGAAFVSATGVGLAAGATAVVGYHVGSWAAQYTTVPMAEAMTNWYYANDIAVANSGFTPTNGGQCTCTRSSNTGGLFGSSTPLPPRTLVVPDQATCSWQQGQRFSQPDGSYIRYDSCSFVATAAVAQVRATAAVE